ncbi:MAG: hypothetical protein ACWGNV_13350, partial [Bacteroidales bacterium]
MFRNPLIVFGLLILWIPSRGQNPFITGQYTADPSAHVFEGRVYVYPSHDRDSSVTFDMVDYHVYSSANLKD